MRIPKNDAARLSLYVDTLDACLASRERRLAQYAGLRRWFLYGTADGDSASPWNKIYSHLDTVTSFLYASDSTRFSMKLGTRAPKGDYRYTGAFGKNVNEEWKASNADIIFQMAILWALVYDSTFVKHIRRSGGTCEPFYVDPGCFGVYREDMSMLDRQEAFVHVYYMAESDLLRRLQFHPQRDSIMKTVTASQTKRDTSTESPPLVERVILSSQALSPMGMENVQGEANVNLMMMPEYAAMLNIPLVEMHELWIWNDAEDDYQIATMANPQIVVYDRSNMFLPRSGDMEGEHPFVQICPNPMPDYFWGACETARLVPLQEKRNARMQDIERLLKKQVDPPGAWGGMGLPEDKLDGFNVPGTQIAISDPSFKYEKYMPQIPADVYADIERIDAEFDEQSGLTNVTKGQGEAGVRSAGHAGKLLTVGSARPKKRALIIEDSLEKSATLFGKCLYVGDDSEMLDDDGKTFIAAQMSPHFTIEVDAHSNSPVFVENMKQDAAVLLKSRSITRQRFIQMMAPPMQEQLVRDLNEKIIPEEKAAAAAKMQLEREKAAPKPPLKSVA